MGHCTCSIIISILGHPRFALRLPVQLCSTKSVVELVTGACVSFLYLSDILCTVVADNMHILLCGALVQCYHINIGSKELLSVVAYRFNTRAILFNKVSRGVKYLNVHDPSVLSNILCTYNQYKYGCTVDNVRIWCMQHYRTNLVWVKATRVHRDCLLNIREIVFISLHQRQILHSGSHSCPVDAFVMRY